jgi:lysophospholipase L1-like esterase
MTKPGPCPYDLRMMPLTQRRFLLIGAVIAVLVVGGGLALTVGPLSGGSKSPAPSASIGSSAGASASADSGSPFPSGSGVAVRTPGASASGPATPPLPALLGAIGDSYSQAYNVNGQNLFDHPTHSWVVGTAKGDGIFSILERFQQLGDKPVVVDAATSGKKMVDASRQAQLVVSAAASLKPGQTAFVTFELGTNDLCDDPKTDPNTFKSELDAAIAILEAGLPAGSRIEMLSVPDFSHFRDITQASSVARTALAQRQNSRRCAPFLGSASPTDLPTAERVLTSYDSILINACDAIQTKDAPAGKLYCRSNRVDLADSDFTIKDLSDVDWFHPSVTGQNKIANAVWNDGYWGSIQFSTRVPGSSGPAGLPLLGLALTPPIALGSRLSRRYRRIAR